MQRETIWRRLSRFPAAVVVVAYMLLDAIVGPLVAPVFRLLAHVRFLLRLRWRIERLGPYPSLLLLLVPVVLLEPLKLGALYLVGTGRVATGTAGIILSHLLSMLFVERLFEVVRPKLLTLRWFARLWSFATAVRDTVLRWLRRNAGWAFVWRDAGRDRAVRLFAALRRQRPPPKSAPP